MPSTIQIAPLAVSEVSSILERTAALLRAFHTSDLALQNALSSLATRAKDSEDIVDLQHVDLVTQTHADLASLLKELAAALSGKAVCENHLKSVLVLRSLQDALIEAKPGSWDVEPGELSLF